MYLITSIFRMETGLIPGFGLAPHKPGEYDLPKPIMLLSAENVHTISKVIVHPARPGVLMSSRRGYIGLDEHSYQEGSVSSIDRAPLGMYDPSKTVEDSYVVNMAFAAACALSVRDERSVNQMLKQYRFHEHRTKPVTVEEFKTFRLYGIDFSTLTRAQVYQWFYHFLVFAHRMGGLLLGSRKSIRDSFAFVLRRYWWRDVILMLLKHFDVDFSMHVFSKNISVEVPKNVFRVMLARINTVQFERFIDDFGFVDSATSGEKIILDKSGNTVIQDEAYENGDIKKTKVNVKIRDYIGVHIEFPEVGEIIENNGLILT